MKNVKQIALALLTISIASPAFAQVKSICGDGSNLPAHQSRNARGQSATCDGSASTYARRATTIPDRDARFAFAFSNSGNWVKHQEVYLKAPGVEWSGELEYTPVVSWTYDVHHNDANADRCGKHNEPYSCMVDDETRPNMVPYAEMYQPMKDEMEEIRVDVMEEETRLVCPDPEPEPEPVRPSEPSRPIGGNSGNSGGNSGSGSTSRPRPSEPLRPDTSRPDPKVIPKDETREGSPGAHGSKKLKKSGGGGDREPNMVDRDPSQSGCERVRTGRMIKTGTRGTGQYRRTGRQIEDGPQRPTGRTLHKQVGWHKKPAMCDNYVANVCEYEVATSATMTCAPQKLKYTAKYAKANPLQWGPDKDPKYLPILPNKYDLLPGEWEKITVISNKTRAKYFTPSVEPIANAWNTYDIQISPKTVECNPSNKDLKFDVTIHTKERILRKSPNAFTAPVDQFGRPLNPLKRDEHNANGEPAPGEPYQLTLLDTSAAAITNAARISRVFDDSKKEMKEQVVEDKTAQTEEMQFQGFWKNTQFRIRLFEKRGGLRKDLRFTQNLHTTSSVVGAQKNMVIIPLLGEDGVKHLYRASGPLDQWIGWLYERTTPRLHLVPGKEYELRVSMYQRGLWFYENDCKSDETIDCEKLKADPHSFSEEILIPFKADPRVDQREALQKFLDWQRASIWEKLKVWRFL